MSFYDHQIQKVLSLRDELFADPGNGLFNKKPWPFVLKDASLNLYEPMRDEAIAFFKENKIPFWRGTVGGPTGHLLSSQVACINHLFFLRNKPELATAVLKALDPKVEKALPLDEAGYVEFEVIGKRNYLGEKSHTRGALSTSIDAAMLAQMVDGSRKLCLIEWKYTESYTPASKAEGSEGSTRLRIYTPLLEQPDCPIQVKDNKALFVEPYYQLMRQTLLAHQMVKAEEYGASDYLHLHIIPAGNYNLKRRNTSPLLAGNDLDSAWKSVLKQPGKYRAIDPETFLQSAASYEAATDWLAYLAKRYWREPVLSEKAIHE